MVCPRCIMAVEDVFSKLDIPVHSVKLGQVVMGRKLSVDEQKALKPALTKLGFELLEGRKSALISQIKALIIEQLFCRGNGIEVNFSTYLSEKLHHEYSYLSRLFSATEGTTIEKYITAQKIEKVKELLYYDELSLSEIAHRLNYSSVAYLSAQFKRETGMTPTAFKKLNPVKQQPEALP